MSMYTSKVPVSRRFFINGSTVHMFSGGTGWGNVLKEMAESNRWILGVNEDPNADYPRLTYGSNSNNELKSVIGCAMAHIFV